ncbi:MAG: ATPase AAA-2 protein [uncultured bacterium]|nr:MAG: ATPase AAA-2 protein [uncultured bacterium]
MTKRKTFHYTRLLDDKKNKKTSFFSWYYEDGLREFLEIWKNFLKFILVYFSIFDLFHTIISPWKRDAQAGNWRGWHPLKTAQLLFNNLFSRSAGLLVRTATISVGLFLFFALFFLGVFLLMLWLIFPALFIFLALKTVNGTSMAFGFFGTSVIYIVIVKLAHSLDTKIPYENMDKDVLSRKKIFERICNRLGMPKRIFPKSVFKSEESLKIFLKSENLTLSDFEKILDWEIKLANNYESRNYFWRWDNLKKISPIGSQWKYAYTVNLDNYSTDLSVFDLTEYRDKKLNGREDEEELLNLILQRPDQNCALIVGGSGIGKSTLVHSFAEKIRLNKADRFFKNKRMVILDASRVIAGAINKGIDAESVLRELFAEVSYAGNIILVIEHLEQYLGKSGNVFHPDIELVMSEFLAHPNFQVIATSSNKEYHQLIEKHDQILKYFEVIEMREPSLDETLDILYGTLRLYESKNVIFTHEALKSIIKESGRYNWSSPLPERAIDLAMDVFTYWEKKSQSLFINEQTVLDFISLKTGMPHGEIRPGERKQLMNLEKNLHQQIIGQEEAVNQIAEALRRTRSGISNSKKPVGSFLFLGPTGVGKTETAKALAKIYFGDEEKMIRFDMSEFQTPSSIDRLIGSSQLNQPGRLATQVKDNPYSLILLDEIEKAYPEILDIFLQILDEGYVTDAFGEKINFRNTIIIATSNAGAALIKNEVEKGMAPELIKKDIIDYAVANNIFRVEFLNRFDGVIFFRPLMGSELTSVVKLMLKKLARRLLNEKNIEVEFSNEIAEKIIEGGYNPIFGARSLNRYIEDTVEDILAKKIISGEVKKGEKIKLGI